MCCVQHFCVQTPRMPTATAPSLPISWSVVLKPDELRAYLAAGGDPNTKNIRHKRMTSFPEEYEWDDVVVWCGFAICCIPYLPCNVFVWLNDWGFDGAPFWSVPPCCVEGVDAGVEWARKQEMYLFVDECGKGSLLHYSIYHAMGESVRLLLEHGASLTSKTARVGYSRYREPLGRLNPLQYAHRLAAFDAINSLKEKDPEAFAMLERYTEETLRSVASVVSVAGEEIMKSMATEKVEQMSRS